MICSSGENASCLQPLTHDQINFLKEQRPEHTFRKSILTKQKSRDIHPDSNGVLKLRGYDRIGSNAFAERDDITTVIIDEASSIGAMAFYQCPNLTSITFNGSIEDIGTGVCYNCPELKNVSISGQVKFIDSMAFRMCPKLNRRALMKRFTGSHFHAKVNKDMVKWGKRGKAIKEYEARRENLIAEDEAYAFHEAMNRLNENK